MRGSSASLLQSSAGSVKPSKSVPIATWSHVPPLQSLTISIVSQIASSPLPGWRLSSQYGMKITPTTPPDAAIAWTSLSSRL